MAYKYPIQCRSQCDSFEENEYTKRIRNWFVKPKKFLMNHAVTATAVRVPVVGGHSEAVNVEFSNDFDA
jgi:aspartate-semialdehyde dehydrogenase